MGTKTLKGGSVISSSVSEAQNRADHCNMVRAPAQRPLSYDLPRHRNHPTVNSLRRTLSIKGGCCIYLSFGCAPFRGVSRGGPLAITDITGAAGRIPIIHWDSAIKDLEFAGRKIVETKDPGASASTQGTPRPTKGPDSIRTTGDIRNRTQVSDSFCFPTFYSSLL